MSYEPQGGGGTDFSSIFTFLVEEEIVPKQLVVFTDGETHNWGTPDYCPTTFIIKNRTTIIAPYGTTVEYT
jgi:predicted metal-dependent peptidase